MKKDSLIEAPFGSAGRSRALSTGSPSGVVMSPFLVHNSHKFHPGVVRRMGAHAPALPHCARHPRFLIRSLSEAPTCSPQKTSSALRQKRSKREDFGLNLHSGDLGLCKMPSTAPQAPKADKSALRTSNLSNIPFIHLHPRLHIHPPLQNSSKLYNSFLSFGSINQI